MAAAYWLKAMDIDGDKKEQGSERSIEDMMDEGIMTHTDERRVGCVKNINELRSR